jgi:predicted acylesterase/phospholipase RssA
LGRPASYDKKVGLVLQGGGALGSYQAGVYEALASSEYLPDWVAGISIGAINAAIIAGNAPKDRVQRLRSFWDRRAGACDAARASATERYLFAAKSFFMSRLLLTFIARRSNKNPSLVGEMRV